MVSAREISHDLETRRKMAESCVLLSPSSLRYEDEKIKAVIATEIMTSLSGGTSLSINPVFFISIKLGWIFCFDNKQGFIRVYVIREELDTIKNDKK